MSREEIMMKLNRIFIEVFDDEGIILNETMTPNDLNEWDSQMQIILIGEIEYEFDIRFTSMDIPNLHSVKDFVDSVEGLLEK